MTPPRPHQSPALSEIREIVRRFNEACRAFNEAVKASQARDVEAHEAALLRSAREMGSALELVVARCAQRERPELRAQRLDFPPLLDALVASGALRLDGGRVEQLKRWRRLRNEAEHAPVRVPPLGSLLDALRGARRFLLDVLEAKVELNDPDRPSPDEAPPPAPRPERPAPPDETHRNEPPEAWVRARIDEGLRRLNAGRAEAPPLVETEVRRALLGLARELAEHESAPFDSILPSSAAVMAIDDKRRLYVEAGFLLDDAAGLRFRDPRLPALLLGLELSKLGMKARERRAALGKAGFWSEAAWAATAAGDLPHDWLGPLLDGGDLYSLPERVLTACAALAGLETVDRGIGDLVERAAAMATEALVWLIPTPEEHGQSVGDHLDVWRLPRHLWQRAVLDLAKVTGALPASASPRDTAESVRIVERWATALGLPPRVIPATARAVRLLCRPWPRDGISPLDEAFFQASSSLRDGVTRHVDGQFHETWMVEAGIPALWKGDKRRASRILAVPASTHPAGFLLNHSGLLSYWCEAWLCFAEAETAAEAAQAWVTGATWVTNTGGLDDDVGRFFLEEAPTRLRELGIWEAALAQLAEKPAPEIVPIEPDHRQRHYCAALLAQLGLSPEAWRERIRVWSEHDHLPWATLLEAGAPGDAIARWCIEKIQQKEREPIKVDGPLGVIATSGYITKTEGWELAYDQAREALAWLLDQGDESAIATLADRCFTADEEQRFNPIMGKFMELGVPLSQTLWGRVIGRPGGRAALYGRVERGDNLGGDEHMLPRRWLCTSAELWEELAQEVGLRRPLERAPTEAESAEVRRLFSAFEQWMSAQPQGLYRRIPERTPWADPAMRSAKTLMVVCGALCTLEVSEQLHTLLRGIVEDAKPREVVLLHLLGRALAQVCARPEEPPEALLSLASRPEVAAQLNSDGTKDFWRALVARHGIDEVLKLADAMAVGDLGLGFFDALAEAAPEALAGHQERPDLLRAVLVRSSEGRFTPSAEWHRRAWERAWKPGEIRELERIPSGDWLEALLEQSRGWAGSARVELLRWLAQRSYDGEVRRRCLAALLESRASQLAG